MAIWMLITHLERLNGENDLCIDIPGDFYSLSGKNMTYDYNPCFMYSAFEQNIQYGTGLSPDNFVGFGAPTGFMMF